MDSCEKIIKDILDLPYRADLYKFKGPDRYALEQYYYLVYYSNGLCALSGSLFLNRDHIKRDLSLIIKTEYEDCIHTFYPSGRKLKDLGTFIETLYEL